MKLITTLLLAALFFGCSSTQNKTPGDSIADSANVAANNSSGENLQPGEGMEFGFCDKGGKELLLLADSLADASQFSRVIAADGKIAAVNYLKKKKAGSEDNGRFNEFNFENCAGYLFAAKENKVTSDHSVVLMTPAFLSGRKYIAVQEPAKKEISSSIKSRIENGKSRKIKNYRCMASIGKDSSIYIIEFENKGDSALAALAFVAPGKIVYQDFPAQWNDMSTWRVDDGGNFGVDYFGLLAVFVKEGKIEMVTDWPGAEGVNTEYLMEEGGKFKSVKEQSRYTAPE